VAVSVVVVVVVVVVRRKLFNYVCVCHKRLSTVKTSEHMFFVNIVRTSCHTYG
jgi:hypothetical protein